MLVICVAALIVISLRPGREIDFFGTVSELQTDAEGDLLIKAVQSGTDSVLSIRIKASERVKGLADEEWTVADIRVGDMLAADFKRTRDGEYYVAKWVKRFPVSE